MGFIRPHKPVNEQRLLIDCSRTRPAAIGRFLLNMNGSYWPLAACRVQRQTILNVAQAPQNKLLKKRVASPNPASFNSF